MQLTRNDLWSLEQYAERRPEFRKKVMQHKLARQLDLGENARLFFEDELTIRYQIQEMLRIEKVFEPQGIQDELDAYNPLIPDGGNWKATFMLQYEDPIVRAEKTRELLGIEKKIWVRVDGFAKIFPFANEDLERDDGEKTSTVHFLRFEFPSAAILALHHDEKVFVGIDHPAYTVAATEISGEIRASLLADLAPVVAH